MARPYSASQKATGCMNELYYRNGPDPEPLALGEDAMYAKITIERYLKEAYQAGYSARHREG